MSLHTLSQERFCELSEGITDALCGVCSSWLLVVFFIHSVPGALSLQALDSISSSWIPMEEALSNCDAVVQPLGLLRCLSQSCQAPTKLCPYMLIPWVKGTCVLNLNSCLSQNQHRAHCRQGKAPAHLVLSYLCLSGLHKWASWTLPVLLKKGHSKNRREREGRLLPGAESIPMLFTRGHQLQRNTPKALWLMASWDQAAATDKCEPCWRQTLNYLAGPRRGAYVLVAAVDLVQEHLQDIWQGASMADQGWQGWGLPLPESCYAHHLLPALWDCPLLEPVQVGGSLTSSFLSLGHWDS